MILMILFVSIIIVLISAFLIGRLPDQFSISRSITIDAVPKIIFMQINDFHNWVHWSPWEKMDPNMKKTFEGPPSGERSIYKWIGNNQVGHGIMTILISQSPNRIVINLDFLKPMKSNSISEFTIEPGNHGCVVTWTMYGKNSFFSKIFHLIMNFEKMVGPSFECGLAQLKAICEAESAKSSAI